MSASVDQLVTLNVGGTLFTTTQHTLTKKLYNNHPRHLLQNIVQGKVEVPKDAQGHYFVDRSAQNFNFILDYLRNDGDLQKCVFPVNKPTQLLALTFEAEYYQLTSLVEYFTGRRQSFDPKVFSPGMSMMDEDSAFCGVGVAKMQLPLVTNHGIWTPRVAAALNVLHVSVKPLYGDQEMLGSGNVLVVGFVGKKRLEYLKQNGMILSQKDLIYRVEGTVFQPKKSLLDSAMNPKLSSKIKDNDPNEMRVYYDTHKRIVYKKRTIHLGKADNQGTWIKAHSEMELTPGEEWFFAVYCNNDKVMVQINYTFEITVPEVD
ncbi:BTB/POZ domain-containing protein [Acrasis kona]|uniref:BTB/POZ domain-containing protein n=1 Tax=Acrasis kona TaxID=1008807 RepID=A0AAW2YVW1_9EUKA